MISNIILVLFFVLFPLFILFLCNKLKFVYKIGPVLLAYVFGIIAGNTGLINESHTEIVDYITMVSITLALPLILFSSDLRTWSKLAPKAILSMVLAMVSIIFVSGLGYVLFNEKLTDGWKISGMLIGVYSGGTPNLGAIKEALNVQNEVYLMTHTYDMVISAFYLLFLLTIGKGVLSYYLPAFKFSNSQTVSQNIDFNGKELFWGLHKKKYIKPLLLALLVSLIIVGISAGIGFQLSGKYQMAVIILLITSLGISASFWEKVRKINKSFELGMYFILIFSLAVASMADISQLAILSPYLFAYVAMAVFGTLIIHVALSHFFKIDTDTTIVISTALICSPPFVPMVAGALKNKEVVLSGIAIGVLGFAIGNYIGIAFAYFLKGVFG